MKLLDKPISQQEKDNMIDSIEGNICRICVSDDVKEIIAMLDELEGIIEDLNPTEIVAHLIDGTLLSWLANLKMQAGMLIAFLKESNLSQKDCKTIKSYI